MFLNLTKRLNNKTRLTAKRRIGYQGLISAALTLQLLVTSVVYADANQFRLRWHQLQIHHFSEDDVKSEIRFGHEVAARILAEMDIRENPTITRYLNLVGQSLVFHSERNELQFHFALLNSPAIGAYSAPGGYVFITQGLYDIIENEAELAAVFAHEIAHINLRHIVNELNIKAVNKQDLSGLARFLGASGDTTRALVNQAVEKAYQVLFKNGFKKNQEMQADANAVQLLALTGYDPGALSSILQRIANLQGSENSKTHPQFERRNQQLHQLISRAAVDSQHFNKAAVRFNRYNGRSESP